MKHDSLKKFRYFVLIILISANLFVWREAAFGENKNLQLYFLDVGQGDSELIDLGSVEILVDGGKDAKVLSELGRALSPSDRYIDLVIATHPDFDHFGGLIDVLKNYEVGMVITNGRSGVAEAYSDFERVIAEKNIPVTQVYAGDQIQFGDTTLKVLWPTETAAVAKKVNESGIVFMLENQGFRALYTADIGFETEQKLMSKYDLSAQVLKVGHHGSKYSTDKNFLAEVNPAISIIEVGKNSYGHPTDAVLGRLASVGAQVFRTDQNGVLKLEFDGRSLRVWD
ncbi:MAG: MBL fold metallo-hydrolase [Patescibacteria group bacterium]